MFMLHCPQGELSFVVQMDYGGGGAVVDLLKFSVNGGSEVAA